MRGQDVLGQETCGVSSDGTRRFPPHDHTDRKHFFVTRPRHLLATLSTRAEARLSRAVRAGGSLLRVAAEGELFGRARFPRGAARAEGGLPRGETGESSWITSEERERLPSEAGALHSLILSFTQLELEDAKQRVGGGACGLDGGERGDQSEAEREISPVRWVRQSGRDLRGAGIGDRVPEGCRSAQSAKDLRSRSQARPRHRLDRGRTPLPHDSPLKRVPPRRQSTPDLRQSPLGVSRP